MRFLRQGGYPAGAAIIGAWRMGKGKPVYVNYRRWRPPLRPKSGALALSQLFARLALLLLIALGFASAANLLLLLPTH